MTAGFSSKSNVWASSGIVSVNLFFLSVNEPYLFLYMSNKFLLKVGILNFI